MLSNLRPAHDCAPGVLALSSHLPIPGAGLLPVNSYLITATESILIDTGLAHDRGPLLDAVQGRIDLADLGWIVVTHDDRDHAGNLRDLLIAAPNATMVTNGLTLARLGEEWDVPPHRTLRVNPGARVRLGDRELGFLRPPSFDSPATLAVYDVAARGIQVHLDTHVTSLTEGRVILDSGHEFNSDTVIWTAGVDPHPLLAATGLAIDAAGRLITNPTLQVAGHPHVFAAGDAAAVPDLTSPDPGATTAPTAQHAVRQAKVLADNILAHLAGTGLRDYAHTHTGAVATLGRHRGVADIYGHALTGWPAWVLHRAYHLAATPTWDRRARVAADWLLNALFDRDIVTLTDHSRALAGALSQPPHPPGRAAPRHTDQTTTGPGAAARTPAPSTSNAPVTTPPPAPTPKGQPRPAPVRNAPGVITADPDTRNPGPPSRRTRSRTGRRARARARTRKPQATPT